MKTSKKFFATKKNKGHFFKQYAFLDLQRIWYDKLAAEGFKDFEAFHVKHLHSERSMDFDERQRLKRAYTPEKQLYFENCREYLHHGTFECERDRKIWELHSEGYSYRKIIREMPLKRSIFWLHLYVKKYNTKMYKYLEVANG